MKKLILTAIAATMITSSANAFSLFGIEFNTTPSVQQEEFSLGFTIPSGSVLGSNGEVTPAHQTESGQRALEQDGYLVAAGNLYVQAGEIVSTISLDDVRNVTGGTDARKAFVESRVKADVVASGLSIEQITDIANAEGHVDLDGLSKEEITGLISENLSEILDSGEISSSIVDALGEDGVANALSAAESAANGVDVEEGIGSLSDEAFSQTDAGIQAAVDAANAAAGEAAYQADLADDGVANGSNR